MLLLKDYQRRTLEALRSYLEECSRLGNVDDAFYATTRKSFGQGVAYRPVAGLEGLPYVCLRIPTGGGKTLVACHSVGIVADRLLHTQQPVVLWLVPSNAIREQTLKALRARKHPYRLALESSFASVSILDGGEALSVQRSTLDAGVTIIVSTMQAFRVEETEGRKVYESAGALMAHFSDLPPDLHKSLEKGEGGVIAYSLANVLRLRRPIVIVDEAHNARTGLSFDTLARFNPSSIIEFTATPDTEKNPSNVLFSVSASELKAESMIKMPIRLQTRREWKELLADAVAWRAHLEALAKLERQERGEYIRPILLIQAQPNRKGQESLTVEVVEKCLIEDQHIPEDHIRRATGVDRGLDDVADLAAEDCPVRVIITVQALREGWDCPFAYVLCSLAEMSSSTAVEQILGRIMRLPRAEAKTKSELNMAYAFVASADFYEAANLLTDALIQNGFQRQEARDFIVEGQSQLPLLSLDSFMGTVSVPVSRPPDLTSLPVELAARVRYDEDRKTLTFIGEMSEGDRVVLGKAVASPGDKAAVETLFARSQGKSIEGAKSPSQRGEHFSVPWLCVQQGKLFEPFEETHFKDKPWKLSECDGALDEKSYASSPAPAQVGEISVTDKGKLQTQFVSALQHQMTLLGSDHGWTAGELVAWLDHSIPHPDITPAESGLFLSKVIRHLMGERKIDLQQLVHDKYRLRQAVEAKFDEHRMARNRTCYHQLLLPESATPLVVSREAMFTYPGDYPLHTVYKGPYNFQKHFYPLVGNLGAAGEEYECAQFLDLLPEVKFWVRNIERNERHSFWFQTSTDRFYPDFVCQLHDGRQLVVEYKNERDWSNDDSTEKRFIGELWEARSKGSCLFILPKGKDFEAIRAKCRES